jgi:hypothetical protein
MKIYIDKIIDDLIGKVKELVRLDELSLTFLDESAMALHDAADMLEMANLLALKDYDEARDKFYNLEDESQKEFPKSIWRFFEPRERDVIVDSEKWNKLIYGEREASLEDIDRDFN